jgi:hypothetical protein
LHQPERAQPPHGVDALPSPLGEVFRNVTVPQRERAAIVGLVTQQQQPHPEFDSLQGVHPRFDLRDTFARYRDRLL